MRRSARPPTSSRPTTCHGRGPRPPAPQPSSPRPARSGDSASWWAAPRRDSSCWPSGAVRSCSCAADALLHCPPNRQDPRPCESVGGAPAEGAGGGPRGVVLRIRARYRQFGLYETAILGMLAQSTGWATAAREVVEAAAPQPVISFGARHVHPDIV